MPEHDEDRPLNRLLAALKEHGWECIADDAERSLIVIDAEGDPHDCWDGYDAVNVCVPMNVDKAVRYLADPCELDRLRTENAKLRELVEVLINCGRKYHTMSGSCPMFDADAADDDFCGAVKVARELGIEVGDGRV